VIYSERSSYAATLLSSSPPGARRDIYTLRAEPGSVRRSDPHMPGTMEHFWLGHGRARVGPVDVPVELGPGDYIAYPGDVPHIFEALDPDTTGVMVLQHM
jgi:mannose-6-phosphate isomerase-like protein (cupin superfamily)